ncbi:MAG: sigma-54-dependent Fis family transcriptional regulator [Bacteroidetes bacterium]|nr:sigma-54-dependent Fis family transcriptional regulator [Bacteroidota bacterium]
MDILSVKQKFGIIGNDPKIISAIEIALRVAATDLSVLVTGESGVGKEFFPQIIHSYSSRKHKNYIAVNCGAIPEGTIDSELFGHEKGSFTGATDNRKGYFEMADGGTIFLDEVAELPQTTQVRLLRVLQAGEFMKVGSSKVQKTNVRVVAATNINLTEAIAKGHFREDLFYRLNTVPIMIPPLRERNGDIYMLFRKFCVDVAQTYSMPTLHLDDDARNMLEEFYWPGNIRQLKNIAEQMSVVEESRVITSKILSKYISTKTSSQPMIIGDEKYHDERELLYTVLYDMRKDIIELKQMVARLSKGVSAPSSYEMPQTTALATQQSRQLTIVPQKESIEDYPQDASVEEVQEGREVTKEEYMRDEIIKALNKNKGKRREAAKDLFISERTLYRRMKTLGIDSDNI